jgi:predicted transposase YbfD/YdcC
MRYVEIKELLEVIKVVTIEAIGTQKEITKKIVEKKGNYVLTVKKNQTEKYERIKSFRDKSFLKRIKEEEIYVKNIEKAHR